MKDSYVRDKNFAGTEQANFPSLEKGEKDIMHDEVLFCTFRRPKFHMRLTVIL